MAIITLRLKEIKTQNEGRAKSCRYCGNAILQSWGKVSKPVVDNQVNRVEVQRYRCCGCGKTFRHYPTGVSRADQSERLKGLAAICWQLGLSLRSVSGVLGAFGVSLSHMSVWRDVQQAGQAPKGKKGVRIAGVDGFYMQVKGKDTGMMVLVDLGTGQPLAIGEINEKDPQAVADWLRDKVKDLGIEVIVTDDLESYDQAAKQLEVKHQVCRFHFLRWVMKAIKEFEALLGEDWLDTLLELRRIVRCMPSDAQHLLHLMWKRVVPPKEKGEKNDVLYRLRLLILRLAENWPRYVYFQQDPDVPKTNNRTEQAIGRWRNRSLTTRGFKTNQGLSAAFFLCNTSPK